MQVGGMANPWASWGAKTDAKDTKTDEKAEEEVDRYPRASGSRNNVELGLKEGGARLSSLTRILLSRNN